MPEERKIKKSWWTRLKYIISYVLFFLVVGWGVDLWRAQDLVSGKAPELTAVSVQGETIDLLAMSQDKPVLVYFWATWCSICSTVSPSVDFVSNHYQVVTVVLNSGAEERVKQYLTAKDYRFTVVNDEKGLISRQWGIAVTPTLFVLNKGEVSSVTTGFTSPMGMWVRLLLAAL
jgi:thiol-disulfide isomerase/thioredoxin